MATTHHTAASRASALGSAAKNIHSLRRLSRWSSCIGAVYNPVVAVRECYHCHQQITEGEPHDCWTTTEAALTADLSEDLREAWERLRETANEFGEQRIYASHHSIMFSRKSCYFFVRPKTTYLEVCVFLGRTIRAPQVRRVDRASKSKIAHLIQVRHRDEVEPPITDWLREAYDRSDQLHAAARRVRPKARGPARKPPRRRRTR
jgi:uncharacterized protein DUF5655